MIKSSICSNIKSIFGVLIKISKTKPYLMNWMIYSIYDFKNEMGKSEWYAFWTALRERNIYTCVYSIFFARIGDSKQHLHFTRCSVREDEFDVSRDQVAE